MTVAITSPLALLRELFTVTGAGTLVRRGATVVAYKSYDDLDRARLEQLMSSAFGRAPVPSFFDRPVDRIYIAGDYRGAAVFTPTDLGGYLSKFAVDVAAQGEGIGRDLWRAMARDYPTYYWRSHPNNPIASWYRNNCDGFVRGESWHVYWRGMPTEKVPAAVDYATGQPADFATGQPADFATK